MTDMTKEFLFNVIHYGKIVTDTELVTTDGCFRVRTFSYSGRHFIVEQWNGEIERAEEIK